MKLKAITLLTALTGVAGQAAEKAGVPAERHVTVCMQSGPGAGVAIHARPLASNMFAAIGVTIEWHHGFQGCPSQAIMISLTDNTPTSLKPGALAYALPYEGTHIRVFYDRISQYYGQNLVLHLLAHVLVHEITHILEGLSRHSASGIMMAHWGQEEFSHMAWRPLEFADEDVDLIYRGLADRARAAVAMNPALLAVAAR
jgi:hypothetical protein